MKAKAQKLNKKLIYRSQQFHFKQPRDNARPSRHFIMFTLISTVLKIHYYSPLNTQAEETGAGD